MKHATTAYKHSSYGLPKVALFVFKRSRNFGGPYHQIAHNGPWTSPRLGIHHVEKDLGRKGCCGKIYMHAMLLITLIYLESALYFDHICTDMMRPPLSHTYEPKHSHTHPRSWSLLHLPVRRGLLLQGCPKTLMNQRCLCEAWTKGFFFETV